MRGRPARPRPHAGLARELGQPVEREVHLAGGTAVLVPEDLLTERVLELIRESAPKSLDKVALTKLLGLTPDSRNLVREALREHDRHAVFGRVAKADLAVVHQDPLFAGSQVDRVHAPLPRPHFVCVLFERFSSARGRHDG